MPSQTGTLRDGIKTDFMPSDISDKTSLELLRCLLAAVSELLCFGKLLRDSDRFGRGRTEFRCTHERCKKGLFSGRFRFLCDLRPVLRQSLLFSIRLPSDRSSVNREGLDLMLGEIRLADLNCPGFKFWRTLHHAINVEHVVVPNYTVEFQGLDFLIFHERIKVLTRQGVPAQGEVAMPVGRCCLTAVDMLGLLTAFDFRGGLFLMRDKKRRGDPFLDSKVKDEIIGGRKRRGDLQNSGCCCFSHGENVRGRFVQEIRGDGRRTERFKKT